MSNSRPYIKWFGRDWLGDPLIRMLQPHEKGIWIDLLCHMMQAEPYGHLAVNGKPMDDDDAARLCGTDKGTYIGCLNRLEQLGVSSRTDTGLLYSRRLVRDHEEYQQAAEFGRIGGGNPSLKPSRRGKNPEARSHSPESMFSIKAPIKGPIKVQHPTLEQVRQYIAEKGYHFDAETFHAHYEANGWVQGAGRPVKSWKACCVTWEGNVDRFSGPANGYRERPDPYAHYLRPQTQETAP